MRQCVIIDGLRTANARAHKEKGWFRKAKPDELLNAVYKGLFERNPSVAPEDVDAVYCGCANQAGVQNDIARLSWLAGGFPESVATNGIAQQCPSGMAAVIHAARAIMCSEGDIYIASGVEDMLHVPIAYDMEPPPSLLRRYSMIELPMAATAEKIARRYKISRKDSDAVAYWSHKRSAKATNEGRYAGEIIPVQGFDSDGNPFVVDRDQWIREDISLEELAQYSPDFRADGVVTKAVSSPLTTGACALLLMNREKADELGLTYHMMYAHGVMAGCDPTMMGIGPIAAVKRLLDKTGLSVGDIGAWEINEAFAPQILACVRELGITDTIPFEDVNIWGGALSMGHPLGESGARIIITLNSIMKDQRSDARYGIAALCGAFGNASATLWKRV